jgi:hypothetical protein
VVRRPASLDKLVREFFYFLIQVTREKTVLNTLIVLQSVYTRNNVAVQCIVTNGSRVKTGGGPQK